MKYDVTKGGYILLGRCGENLARTVEIDVSEYLKEYPGAVVTLLHRRHGESGIYPVAAELRDGCLIWQPTSADTAIVGDGEAEVRVTVDGVLAKSKILSTMVDKSLTGQETDAPKPGMDWVDKITTAIGSVQSMKAEAESVAYGEPATAEYDGKTGTMHFGIPEGRPGRDGKDGAPGVKGDKGDPGPKGDPGSDASVTAENIQSALGYAPVKDVQAAGTSILADGVANIKANAYQGVSFNSLHELVLFPAGADVLNPRVSNRAITPINLDYAVKAAMCDGKGAAWTSAEQKAARDRMGVDKPYELIEEITLTESVKQIERLNFDYGVSSLVGCVELPVVTAPFGMFMTALWDGDSYITGYSYGLKEAESSIRFELAIHNGIITGQCQGNGKGWGNGTIRGVNNAASLKYCDKITGVRFYVPGADAVIPANAIVRIYGVRA